LFGFDLAVVEVFEHGPGMVSVVGGLG